MADVAPLTVSTPPTPAKGGIIVVQEAFGVNHHIEQVVQRIGAAGWLAVAPHLFHRTGDPKLPYEMSAAREHMEQLTAEGILADIDTALAHLATAGFGPARVGVVGFCMGGNVSLVTATRRDVGAAVSFYGGGLVTGRFGFGPLVDEVGGLRAPWLGLFGDLDKGIPVEQVERLREAASRAAVETEIVRYPDAGHGFNCDARPDYHEPSATDAWARMLAWFDRHLR